MRQEAELSLRRLLLTVSTFVLLASLIAIYALQWVPQEPLHLRTTLTVYVAFFWAMSFIGLIAAIKVRGYRKIWQETMNSNINCSEMQRLLPYSPSIFC